MSTSSEICATIESHEIWSEVGIQHILICDGYVSEEVITQLVDKMLGSSSKTFSIDFCHCKLTAGNLEHLCDKIKNARLQIKSFAISYMDNIHEFLKIICYIVGMYGISNLCLAYDEMNDGSVDLLLKYLEDAKIKSLRSLDISYNSDISAVGFQRVGELIRKFDILSLKATACEITDRKLNNFLDGLYNKKLEALNIGRNKKLTNEGFRTLAKFVGNKGTNRLELSGCRLSRKNMETFYKYLPNTGQEPLLEELDISYNSTTEDFYTFLGLSAAKCGVTKLSMAGCRLSEDNLVCLGESLKDHKIRLINIRDNATIGDGMEEVAKLVLQCKVKELNICDCRFCPEELRSFRNALCGAQVKRLHLGDKGREPDEKYIDQLCALLVNVEDVLYLRFSDKLSDAFRTALQNSCRKFTKINLVVGAVEEEIQGNKSSRVETGIPSANEEPSISSPMKKPRLDILESESKAESGNQGRRLVRNC